MQRLESLLTFAVVLFFSIILASCADNPKNNIITPPASSKDFVYTANAAGATATVSAFTSDRAAGKLTSAAGSPFNAGSGAVALAADPAGKFLYAANYFSSDISGFNIDSATGVLTAMPGSPFPAELGINSLAVDSASRYVFAASERSGNLWAYSIGSTGSLTPLAGFPEAIIPSGMGASALVLDPSGKFLYVFSHDSLAAGIFGFSVDGTSGSVTPLSGFPVRIDGMANKAVFDASGKFLLVTGTGIFGLHGGVSAFSINTSNGSLTGVGSTTELETDPSGLAVAASGKYLYIPNTGDASISAFSMGSSGALTPISGSPFPSGGNGSVNGPLGIAADADGKFVYVCNASNDISVFSIGSSGALTPVSGSPFPAGGNAPSAIVFVKSAQ